MKRFVLALLLGCCALTLAAQEAIPVNYKGEKPGIGDFAWAFVSAIDDDEEVDVDESANAFRQAWIRYRQGAAQPDGETLTVDLRNGFVLYESADDAHLLRIEMCYWNESDQKHKMVAYCVSSFFDIEYGRTTQRILKWNGHGFSF